MANYLDSMSISADKELLLDPKSKSLLNPRYFTLFQSHKYRTEFDKMRPDLGLHDSYVWQDKFATAEKVLLELYLIQVRNVTGFNNRFGARYIEMVRETSRQIRTMNNTRHQLVEGSRVGELAEVQAKVNLYERMMDKVRKYEMMYPLTEAGFEKSARRSVVDVKARQNAVKERLLREMGVDFSLI